MKHQIILLGKDITSVYHGIKEFGPDHVHLLCTNETKDVALPYFRSFPTAFAGHYTGPNHTTENMSVTFAAKYTKRILPPNLPTTCRKVPK